MIQVFVIAGALMVSNGITSLSPGEWFFLILGLLILGWVASDSEELHHANKVWCFRLGFFLAFCVHRLWATCKRVK